MQRAAEFSAAHFFDRKGLNFPGRNRKMEQVREIDRYEMKVFIKRWLPGLQHARKAADRLRNGIYYFQIKAVATTGEAAVSILLAIDYMF